MKGSPRCNDASLEPAGSPGGIVGQRVQVKALGRTLHLLDLGGAWGYMDIHGYTWNIMEPGEQVNVLVVQICKSSSFFFDAFKLDAGTSGFSQ